MTFDSDADSVTSDLPKQLDIATVCIYGLSILSVGLFLFLPLVNLLSPSPWQRYMGAIHGTAALLAVIVIAYAGHMAFPLLRGVSKILPQMRTLTFWSTCLSFLTIASGNWVYMRYRAPIGGARAWLTKNTPLVHYLFMEYHEFTVLFTFPLGVACTWILWKYGDSILDKKNRVVLNATCVALMAMMFFAIGGFVSGLNVARIHTL
ncbi:hypothetical protein H6G41_02165 [Tolypothrix sp. FACHB-123]|uniref:hypothetical protein n=1 Tax=Tolypothrix sp. FACHB-123 TaxID=2692868 RepID=UPI00168A2D6F|nr:hypothetical protein [Tolypothrix sp. FACHB-123]MBD2353438.1 hypothetical protein [Tolypothrix sp. FACHB-123]